ncbi:MAG: PocR ligand-binding domain-containing protein [Nitrospirota bacterium]
MHYKLQDLIDMKQFQSLQDRLNEIYSFPSAIIDNEGTILTATAWQDVCTKYHRANEQCRRECIKSDRYIMAHLAEADPAVSYRCPHGLIDNAIPIIIDGKHLGNFFTGQFFLEKPNLEFFKSQASKYGFNEAAYLDAVRRVPIWKQEQLNSYLLFIKGLIEVIAGIGLKNLNAIETARNLRDSEEKHRTIIQTAMDGFWLTDREGRLLQVNDAYCRMSGYTEPELLAMNISDLEAQESPEDIVARIGRLMSGRQERFETRHRRKDGTVYDLDASVQYLFMGEGRIVAFFHDIAERKRFEETLRSREAFIRNILESVDEGIIVIDRDYRVLSANKAFSRIVALPETDVVGRFCYDVSHGSDTPCFEAGEDCPVKYTFERGTSLSVTHVHKDAAGASRHLEIKTYPIRAESGRVVSAIETINDITEKTKLEEQLRQAQKMEAIGTLAGGIAHDFNNILTVITGYGNIVKMHMKPDDPHKASLSMILEASERAANLTQALLAFSRKQAINTKPVDLNSVVRNVEKLLRRLIGEDIEFIARLSETGLITMADPGQIEQVLMNLATNARDAMPEGGSLIITTEETEHTLPDSSGNGGIRNGKYALISVSDTGVGLDAQAKDKIFEPFYTTKAPGKGTGLGLAIAYGIVKQHDGNISVYSEPGKGTTFRIYIPLLQASVNDAPAHSRAAPRGGTETILIAEDEDSVRRLIQTTLTDFGYRVIPCVNGRDALDKYALHKNEVDLMLLDVIMPVKSGRDVYDSVRSSQPDMPILFMSGYTADILRAKGIVEKEIQMIPKPMEPYALLQKIREMLDSA